MQQPTPSFGLVDWSVIALYMAGMVGIGFLSSRKQNDAEAYFLAARSMPMWAVALSLLATSLSAATFIGAPQMSFSGDLTYLILNLGGIIAGFVVAFAFIPPIYRAGTVTIYGYLGKRFGPPSTLAASMMFLFGRLLASGARLFMAGIAFSLILYGDILPKQMVGAIVFLGVIGTLYTACGGIRAVIWTDVAQIVVVVFAALLSITLLLRAIPLSLPEIVSMLREADDGSKLRLLDMSPALAQPYTLWTALIASTMVSTACYGVDHDLAQRMMTAKSPWKAGQAMIGSTLLGIPVVCLFMVIGLLLYIFYSRPDVMGAAAPFDIADDSRKIYPQFLLNHLPAGLRGLSMAGLLAAAMSSFDSAINAMASVAFSDLYLPLKGMRTGRSDASGSTTARKDMAASRTMVVIMGALLTCFAVAAVFMQEEANDTLIGFALGVMAFALAPLLGVFSAALFTRRGNNASVIAALAIGILTVLLLQAYALPRWCGFELAWPWVWVVAAPVSFLVCILGAPYRKIERSAST